MRCPSCAERDQLGAPRLIEGPPPRGEHPDIDVVRRVFQLLERGQVDQMITFLSDDFEGRPMSKPVVVKGRQEADAFVRTANEGERSLEPSVYRFERNGHGQVGVFGRLRVLGPDGLVDTQAAWIYSVRDGKIVRADSFTSMEQAHRALYDTPPA